MFQSHLFINLYFILNWKKYQNIGFWDTQRQMDKQFIEFKQMFYLRDYGITDHGEKHRLKAGNKLS